MNSPNLKNTRVTNNDPWAILIALACLIIVATGTAIVVIIILWDRYRKNRIFFERNQSGFSGFEMPTTSAMVSFNENPEVIQNTDMRQPKEYEIQSLDMYVPNGEEREDYMGIQPGHAPGREGMRPVSQLREMQLNPNLYSNRNFSPIYPNNNNRMQNLNRIPNSHYNHG